MYFPPQVWTGLKHIACGFNKRLSQFLYLQGVGFAQSRSFTGFNQELKNPILEISLGRPEYWQNEEHE
jgi:hypothetical protein